MDARRLDNREPVPIPTSFQIPSISMERNRYLAGNQITGWTTWKLRNRQTVVLLPERLTVRVRLECVLCSENGLQSTFSPLETFVECGSSTKVLAHSADGRFMMNTVQWQGAVLTFYALIEGTPDKSRGNVAIAATVNSPDSRVRILIETYYEKFKSETSELETISSDANSATGSESLVGGENFEHRMIDFASSSKDSACWVSQKDNFESRRICAGNDVANQIGFDVGDLKHSFSHSFENGTSVFQVRVHRDLEHVVSRSSQSTGSTQTRLYWLSTSPKDSYEKIMQRIQKQRHEAMDKSSDITQATAAVIQSNMEYLVQDSTIVSFVSPAFGNTLYEWDNYFVTFMMAARLEQIDLAMQMFVRIVATKAVSGQTPNVSFIGDLSVQEPIHCTDGRTEPPVGVLVLSKILKFCEKKQKDCSWLPRLVANDLLRWNDWFWSNRRFAGRDLLVLGDDTPGSEKQQAIFESGLDNSPLYDDVQYDSLKQRMLLFDVGMTGLYVHETKLLSDIFEKYIDQDWGKTRTKKIVNQLRTRVERVSRDIQDYLWNNQTKTYENVLLQPNCTTNCELGPLGRYAPTMFFPLLGKVATDHQANVLIMNWLLDGTKFCLGENTEKVCSYGVPSISATDSAFPEQKYWRGRVWGPHVFLVYESILQYKHLSSAQEAIQLLRHSSRKLFLIQWLQGGYVLENYSAIDGTGCGSQAKAFYHWGALLGMVADDPLEPR